MHNKRSNMKDVIERAAQDRVSTGSPLRMRWMTWFQGYRVSSIEREPKGMVFGKVVYNTTWWLRKEDSA